MQGTLVQNRHVHDKASFFIEIKPLLSAPLGSTLVTALTSIEFFYICSLGIIMALLNKICLQIITFSNLCKESSVLEVCAHLIYFKQLNMAFYLSLVYCYKFNICNS